MTRATLGGSDGDKPNSQLGVTVGSGPSGHQADAVGQVADLRGQRGTGSAQ